MENSDPAHQTARQSTLDAAPALPAAVTMSAPVTSSAASSSSSVRSGFPGGDQRSVLVTATCGAVCVAAGALGYRRHKSKASLLGALGFGLMFGAAGGGMYMGYSVAGHGTALVTSMVLASTMGGRFVKSSTSKFFPSGLLGVLGSVGTVYQGLSLRRRLAEAELAQLRAMRQLSALQPPSAHPSFVRVAWTGVPQPLPEDLSGPDVAAAAAALEAAMAPSRGLPSPPSISPPQSVSSKPKGPEEKLRGKAGGEAGGNAAGEVVRQVEPLLVNVPEGGEPALVIYGAMWCPDTRRSKQLLDDMGIGYAFYDTDLVGLPNVGNKKIPTIVWRDGTYLQEPTNSALVTACLAFSA